MAIQSGIAKLAEFLSSDPTSIPEVIEAVQKWDREGSRRAALAGMLALGRCGTREALDALVGLHPSGLSDSGIAVLPIALAQTRSPRPPAPAGKWVFSVLDGQVAQPIAEEWLRRTLLDWYETPSDGRVDMTTEWRRNLLVVLGFSAVADTQIFGALRAHFPQGSGEMWQPGSHHILAALGASGEEDARVVEFLWDLVLNAPTAEDVAAAASACLGTRHPDALRWAQQYVADLRRPADCRIAVLTAVPGSGVDVDLRSLTAITEEAVALVAADKTWIGGQRRTDLVPFFNYVQRVSSGDSRCSVAVGRFAAILLRHDGWQHATAQQLLSRFSGDEPLWLHAACEHAAEDGLPVGALIALAEKVAGSSMLARDRQRCISDLVLAADKAANETERANALKALRSIQNELENED
jgi:hypothetical protein